MAGEDRGDTTSEEDENFYTFLNIPRDVSRILLLYSVLSVLFLLILLQIIFVYLSPFARWDAWSLNHDDHVLALVVVELLHYYNIVCIVRWLKEAIVKNPERPVRILCYDYAEYDDNFISNFEAILLVA